MSQTPIAIVGGGLAGIAAALEIERQGKSAILFEASNELGGRVRTDRVDGFLLDRGFQVLLSSYPEVKRLGVREELELRSFSSGAYCQNYLLTNPLRHPLIFCKELRNLPWTVLGDFPKLARVLLSRSTSTFSTHEYLCHLGVSEDTRRQFLEPFFGGVFLDASLGASAQLFRKYLHLFSFGRATLPAGGMQALPKQLAKRLQHTELRLNCPVAKFTDTVITTESGEEVATSAVILAVDNPTLNRWKVLKQPVVSCTVTCCYFSVPSGKIPRSPFLRVSSNGPVANLAQLNHVQPTYAPKEQDLLSATIINPYFQQRTGVEDAVLEQLMDCYALPSSAFTHVKTYRISHALPSQATPPPLTQKVAGYSQVFLAGEAVADASINGALTSGRLTGAAVCACL